MLNAARRRVLPSARPRFLWSPIVGAPRVQHIAVRTIIANAPIPKKTKVWDSVDDAVADIKDGSTILSGGTLTRFPDAIYTC
jgi:3-oxoacid CoA-transferase